MPFSVSEVQGFANPLPLGRGRGRVKHYEVMDDSNKTRILALPDDSSSERQTNIGTLLPSLSDGPMLLNTSNEDTPNANE